MAANILRKRMPTWSFVLVAAGLALLASACAQSVPVEQVKAKDQEIASLKQEIANLQTQLKSAEGAQQDAAYWKQLTSLMKPVEMKTMTDHRAYMLPSGVVLALHFDHLNLDQAKNLNWVALGVPGKYCKQDQERVEKSFGQGFTHFHDLKNDTHGGTPGAEGVWFVHVAVRDFEAPWGKVQQGIDSAFMPTKASACA
ncbi:MAG: hypothetical protein HY690_09035 [Chloroflexi bacterium]|nr:hypothetical protein [Chloroflexota bacterium]